MKKNYKAYMKTILIGVFTLALISCKEDEPDTTKSLHDQLAHTWQLTDVQLDGSAVTGYEDFELTLSGNSDAAIFIARNRPDNSPWPASGSWKLGDPASSKIIRDPSTVDELMMGYEVTATTLRLEFEFSGEGYAGSRMSSVSGQWEFEFVKK